jgi:hypothetical protein
MYLASKSWSDRNPDYNYFFFDDEECRSFIKQHFDADVGKSYEALPAGAFRADLWRYCALFVHGGIYADIDTTCRMPLRKLLRQDDEFVIAHGNSRQLLFNAFICSIAGHPFLQAAIERAKDQILASNFQQLLARDPRVPFQIVGPGGLAAAVNATLGRPESTEFTIGRHKMSGISFRVLRKIHRPQVSLRRVMYGFRTVIMCKYPGYMNDLKAAGRSHWAD